MLRRWNHWLRFASQRYPRTGGVRALREALLLCRWFLGVYAGAVAINLYTLFVSEPSEHTGRLEVLHALLLPRWFASEDTPTSVYIGITILLSVLILGCLWATIDLRNERIVLRQRMERAASQNIENEILRDQQNTQRDPQLLVMSILGAYPPEFAVLDQPLVSVGRDTSNTIEVRDPEVSRREMLLAREGGRWRVTRCENAAPMYINGQQLDEASLRHRDQLVIGKSVFRLDDPISEDRTIMNDPTPRLVVGIPSLNVTFVTSLRQAKITLGRAHECGVVIPSKIVGRLHAELLRVSDGAYEIRDLHSRNGLQFHGKRISSLTFRAQETLTIGGSSGVDLVTLTYLPPEGVEPTYTGWEVTEGHGG
jgi:pSer/pThr/pTyr-binding forkhead associated (FHA) protein